MGQIEQNLDVVESVQFATPVLPARGMAQETAQIVPVAAAPPRAVGQCQRGSAAEVSAGGPTCPLSI